MLAINLSHPLYRICLLKRCRVVTAEAGWYDHISISSSEILHMPIICKVDGTVGTSVCSINLKQRNRKVQVFSWLSSCEGEEDQSAYRWLLSSEKMPLGGSLSRSSMVDCKREYRDGKRRNVGRRKKKTEPWRYTRLKQKTDGARIKKTTKESTIQRVWCVL